MVFSSTVFLFLFLPIVLVIYFNPFFKGRKFRNVFLFLASLAFYAYGEPVFVFLMLFSILVTWFIALNFRRVKHRGGALFLGLLFHICILFVFKYLSFFAGQFGLLLHQDIALSITLPIGISFFTFQLMSYLIDVYRGDAQPQKNLLYVGLYVSLFPQLIAGPIVRYRDIEYEIEHRVENRTDFTEGVSRFIYGLSKKLLLANFVAVIADNMFLMRETATISVSAAWLGAVAYTLQIYFDFSGYSDMAIGLGRMFGFHFKENFNYPYLSKSATEFWRRWHISLSSWFRDYVYIPLGGNRVSRPKWIRNLFVVWLLTGIWHGANWTFLLWGLYYFVFLLVEKLTGFSEKLGRFGHVYAMVVVIIGWVIFRSDNLSLAGTYLGTMFGINANGFCDLVFTSTLSGSFVVLLAAIVLSMPVFPFLKKKLTEKNQFAANVSESVLLAVLFVLSLLVAVSSTYNPFIYFNF